uniref:Major intrinsically disordered Notch2-binding receptor 1-like C-terminal domain-containing protein n=1 Tax=Oryzias latipes TaxID=8090 RepID=A0A3P9IHC1_ORYLA
MDISVFPNSNHPDKFLQLNVGTLGAMQGVFQMGAFMSNQKRWQNGIYSQWEKTIKAEDRGPPTQGRSVAFVDKRLEKHITPFTLTSNIKTNPLYSDIAPKEDREMEKPKPSWTIKDYHTQTIHRHLTNYLKENTPKDLDFWLEDLYTPGFDSLLKRKEAEERKKKLCKILSLVFLFVCGALVVIIVPVLVLRNN